jgi:hypothetical protein
MLEYPRIRGAAQALRHNLIHFNRGEHSQSMRFENFAIGNEGG